jgi:hypothetical protein
MQQVRSGRSHTHKEDDGILEVACHAECTVLCSVQERVLLGPTRDEQRQMQRPYITFIDCSSTPIPLFQEDPRITFLTRHHRSFFGILPIMPG